MKDTGKECSCDPRTQEKSFLVWWARLTDYCWELFKYNLWYLLFALPSFLCMLIFLVFSAHLFLLAGLILLIPAGPAMLTLYEAATKIAAGELRTVLPRFFSTYKRHCRPGFAFSFALAIIVLVTLYPVYFVLVTSSVMKIGKASFFAGLLQATWFFCCMIYPYVAVFAALLGIPAVIRMTVMYILPQAYEE